MENVDRLNNIALDTNGGQEVVSWVFYGTFCTNSLYHAI